VTFASQNLAIHVWARCGSRARGRSAPANLEAVTEAIALAKATLLGGEEEKRTYSGKRVCACTKTKCGSRKAHSYLRAPCTASCTG